MSNLIINDFQFQDRSGKWVSIWAAIYMGRCINFDYTYDHVKLEHVEFNEEAA